MRKILATIGIILGIVLGTTLVAHAATSVFQAFQGGTGTSTPSGILYGSNSGQIPLQTVTIGAGCTFISGTLSCAGTGGGTVGTSSVPVQGGLAWWTTTTQTPALLSTVATTTLAGGGPITVSNSPIVIGTSGAVLGCTPATGSVPGCIAAADWTNFNNKISSSSLSAAFPLAYNSGTGAFTSLFSTTTNSGIGNNLIVYTNTAGALVGAASSSLNIGGTALNVTGVVALVNGGTGLNSVNGNSILYSNSGGTAWVLTSTSTLNIGGSAGSVANALTLGSTLTGSSYNGSSPVTTNINLTNPNSWTGLQVFANATSTLFSSTNAWINYASTTNISASNEVFTPEIFNSGNLELVAGGNTYIGANNTFIADVSTTGFDANTTGLHLGEGSNPWTYALITYASSTAYTSTYLFSTQATTSALAVTSLANSLLATNPTGGVVATTSIGTNYLTGTLFTVTTAAPLGGAGTISNGGTLALSCATCNVNPFPTSTAPLIATYFVATGTTASTFPFATFTQATTTSFYNTGITNHLAWFNASNQEVSTSSIGVSLLLAPANSILSGNSAGAVVASSTFGSSLLMVPANAILAGNSLGNLVASTTIGDTLLSGNPSSIFGFNNLGQPVATTSIGTNLLAANGVSAGSYTNANITVGANGIVTAASNGTGGTGGADPFYHPTTLTSATTSSMLFYGNASSTEFEATSTVWLDNTKSAILLTDSNGKVGTYAGTNPCSANQAIVSLSALGAGSCSSTFLTSNQTVTLSGAVSGSGATSITTAFDYIPWGGSLATTEGTSAIASTTAVWFQGPVIASSTLIAANASTTLLTAGTLWDSGLTSGNCVQASTGGLLVSAAGACGGGSTSPGGSAGQVQFNNGSAFEGDQAFTFATTTSTATLTVGKPSSSFNIGAFALSYQGSVTDNLITFSTSGNGGTSGAKTITVPATTGTLCLTTTCLTANQNITLSGDVTGSGATAITTAFNLANTHYWTATQNFTNASTSQFTATSTAWLLGNSFFGSSQQSNISATGVLTLGTPLVIGSGGTGLGSTGASSTVFTTNGTAGVWQKIDLAAGVYGTLPNSNLTSNISAGSCTSCNLTYNAQGMLTVASNGTGGAGGITWPWNMITVLGTSTDATTTALQIPELFVSSTATSTFAGSLQVGTTTGTADFVLNGTLNVGPNILQVATSTNQNIFDINNNGLVGVGTSTNLWAALTVKGSIYVPEASSSAPNSGASLSVDPRVTPKTKVEITANFTVDISDDSNAPGFPFSVEVCQDTVGNHTLVINSSSTIVWQNDITPIMSTTTGACDFDSFQETGATGTVEVFGQSSQYFP